MNSAEHVNSPWWQPAKAWHMFAGTLLILLAVALFLSLVTAEISVSLLLVLLYSNLIPNLALLLCYNLLRRDEKTGQPQVRHSELILIALISTLALPIATFYYLPLAVISIGLVFHGLRSFPSGRNLKDSAWAVVGMLIWPSAMILIVILSSSPLNPLFSGIALTWAVVAFEIGIRGFGRDAGRDGVGSESRNSGWIEGLGVLTSVLTSILIGLAFWLRLVPNLGLKDGYSNVLALTVVASLALTGLSNLVVSARNVV